MSRLAHSTLILMGLIIGTGAYVVFSPMMYALATMAALMYVFGLAKKKITIKPTGALVFVLYTIFLLLNFSRDMDGSAAISRLYANFFSGICIYLIAIKLFYFKPDPRPFRVLPLACILINALGIILQAAGVADFTGQEIGEGIDAALLRPGGFLNPNMSAALALVWLFVALETQATRSFGIKVACLIGCVSILAVTQSRGAMLFLALYFICKVYESGLRNIRLFLLALLCFFVAFQFLDISELLGDLYRANLVRAQGDTSSQERYLLLKSALNAFMDFPLTGVGMRAAHGFSEFRGTGLVLGTHNEIVEWLVNFGIVGFCVMSLVYFRFYHASSVKYLCLCVLPSFLFSHNFFETTALQVALAFAFCLSRRAGKKTYTWKWPAAGRIPAR